MNMWEYNAVYCPKQPIYANMETDTEVYVWVEMRNVTNTLVHFKTEEGASHVVPVHSLIEIVYKTEEETDVYLNSNKTEPTA